MTDLKLIALDDEDLGVLSAHLQDALITVGELAYLPREKRFAAMLKRFDWATAIAARRQGGANQRALCALRFERVLSARLQGIDLAGKTRVLSLLALTFEPGVAPGGSITMIFAGNAAIRLEVECIEAELKDLGGAWRANARPDHSKPDADEAADAVETSETSGPAKG